MEDLKKPHCRSDESDPMRKTLLHHVETFKKRNHFQQVFKKH